MKSFSFLILLLLLPIHTHSKDIYEMSIQELMKIEVSIASSTPKSFEKSPGVITLITKNDIEISGSRNLIDVMRLIPGVSFTRDFSPGIELNFRGNNSINGKILVLIDGMELNEGYYGIFTANDRIDINMIDRVEVLRGSGSSIHGAWAEYAVINIITKSAEEINGFEVSSSIGTSESKLSRTTINMQYAYKSDNYSVKAFANAAKNFSNSGNFRHMAYDQNFDLTNNSFERPYSYGGEINFHDFKLQFIRNQTNTSVPFSALYLTPFTKRFINSNINASYNFKLNDVLTIIPNINFKSEDPFIYLLSDESFLGRNSVFNQKYQRLKPSITINYIKEKFNLTGGVEFFREFGSLNENTTGILTDTSLTMNTISIFSELFYDFKYFETTFGLRYNSNEFYGDAITPRFAITKKYKSFNFIAQINRAYRTPSVGEITDGVDLLKPEYSNAIDFLISYQIDNNSLLTFNFFDIFTQKPIIFSYDANSREAKYQNLAQAGSRGIEITYKFKRDKYNFNLNTSYAFKNHNEVDLFSVPGRNNDYVLGIPNLTINFWGGFRITNGLFFNSSYALKGTSFAYYADGTQDPIGLINGIVKNRQFAPEHLINLNLISKSQLIEGLDIKIGIYNLLNDKYNYHHSYSNLTTSLPGVGREIFLSFNYNLSSD